MSLIDDIRYYIPGKELSQALFKVHDQNLDTDAYYSFVAFVESLIRIQGNDPPVIKRLLALQEACNVDDIVFLMFGRDMRSDELKQLARMELRHIQVDFINTSHPTRVKLAKLDDDVELLKSIRERGLLNPIVCRAQKGRTPRVDLTDGYRRLFICRALSWEKIPAYVF